MSNNIISEREKYLMQQAWNNAEYYSDMNDWLNEAISDSGHFVEQHLDHDATRLHGDDRITVLEKENEDIKTAIVDLMEKYAV